MKHITLETPDFNYPIYSSYLTKDKKRILKLYFRNILQDIPFKERNIYVWFTGTSGVCLFSLLMSLFPNWSNKIIPVSVRKDKENHHDTVWEYKVFTVKQDPDGYHIFLDDCIDKGNTFLNIKKHSNIINEVWVMGKIPYKAFTLLASNNVEKVYSKGISQADE